LAKRTLNCWREFGALHIDMKKNIIGLNSTENNDVTMSLCVQSACPQIQVLHG
jgi:hypothetical protein